jgi:hypothetical protein
MSSIFGETHGKFSYEDTEIELLYSVVAMNFVIPDNIMHQSVVSQTGHRTWSKKGRFVEFVHAEYLFKYSNSYEMAQTLLNYEDKVIVYYYMNGGLIQEMYVENVEIKPLIVEDFIYQYGVAIMTLKNWDYIQISRNLKYLDDSPVKFLNDTIAKTRGIVL